MRKSQKFDYMVFCAGCGTFTPHGWAMNNKQSHLRYCQGPIIQILRKAKRKP